jgi:hypothetical protein
MITTECPECDEPFMVPLDDNHLFEWQRVVCDKCGAACFVEHRRLGGLTLSEDAFREMERTKKRPVPEG